MAPLSPDAQEQGLPKGSSKAGRPKKDGARKPCGRLKRRGVNARTLEIRAELLGADPVTGKTADGRRADIVNASSPIDLALARGFIDERLARVAADLAAIYRRAAIQRPGVRTHNYDEVEVAAELKFESFSTLSGKDLSALWDKVFCDEPAPEDREARCEAANDLWGRLMNGLDRQVQTQLFEVCVLDSWPQWLVYRCAGKDVPPGWARREEQLRQGLEIVRNRLAASRPPKQAPVRKPGDRGALDAAGQRRKRRLIEEQVVYADEDGRDIPMVSDETGVKFELYRLRPR